MYKNIIEQDAEENRKYETFWYLQHPELLDVRNDPAYRKIDVDFLWQHLKVELKSGTTVAEWGNIPVEYINVFYTADNASYQPGWLYLSQADIIVYYDYKLGTDYAIHPGKLRAWVKNKPDIAQYSRTHKKNYDKDTDEISNFYALPVQELIDAGVIVGVDNRLTYMDDSEINW